MYAFERQYCAVLVPNVGDPRLLTFCSSCSKQFIMPRLSEALLLLTCDYVNWWRLFVARFVPLYWWSSFVFICMHSFCYAVLYQWYT